MRTAFRAETLADPHMKEAEHALRTCVHCGFCLPTCPTYLVLGDERDSPRGRIVLMQNMLQSEAPPSAETVKHLDQCLSCLGCRTACPSGVDYAALIDKARAHIEIHYRRPPGQRLFRAFVLFVLTRPRLFAALGALARLFSPLLALLPGKLGVMAQKAPRAPRLSPQHREVVEISRAAPRVGLVPGCVQRAVAPQADFAVRRVLARAGIRGEPLDGAGCCGALAYHLGKTGEAKLRARRVIEAFERAGASVPLEAVSITATGCSAFLKDYARVFADEPEWLGRAQSFVAKAKDFSELVEPGKLHPLPGRAAISAAYHPPCSLQHGQRIRGRGEELLAAAGFEVRAIPDSHLCCGSAGSYSLFHPEIAAELRARKLANIKATGADVLASGNVGCLTHLAGPDCPPTVHLAELLDWAEGGPKPVAMS
jgi:glycolate oxidase iron-sulfur subunit